MAAWKFVIALVILFSVSFAANSGVDATGQALVSLYQSLAGILPITAMLMIVLGAVIYGSGQMLGAETRARAVTWATACITGGVVQVLIITVAPPVFASLYGANWNMPLSVGTGSLGSQNPTACDATHACLYGYECVAGICQSTAVGVGKYTSVCSTTAPIVPCTAPGTTCINGFCVGSGADNAPCGSGLGGEVACAAGTNPITPTSCNQRDPASGTAVSCSGGVGCQCGGNGAGQSARYYLYTNGMYQDPGAPLCGRPYDKPCASGSFCTTYTGGMRCIQETSGCWPQWSGAMCNAQAGWGNNPLACGNQGGVSASYQSAAGSCTGNTYPGTPGTQTIACGTNSAHPAYKCYCPSTTDLNVRCYWIAN